MQESTQTLLLDGQSDSDGRQTQGSWLSACLDRVWKRSQREQRSDDNEQQTHDHAKPLLAEENDGRSDEQQEEKNCSSFVWPTTKRAAKLLLSFDISWAIIAMGWFLSHSGEKQAKAVPAINTILSTVAMTQYVGVVGIIFELPQLLTQYKGSEEVDLALTRDKIERSPRNAAIAGLPYLLFSSLMFAARPLLTLFKQDEDVIDVSGDFFDIYAWFMLAAFIPRVVTNFQFQAFEREGAAMAIADTVLAGSIIWQARIVSARSKPSGVQGIAWVSGGALAVSTLMFLTYIKISKKFDKFNFKFLGSLIKEWEENRKQIVQYFINALPMVVVTLTDISASLGTTLVAGSIEDENQRNSALRALNFMAQYMSLSKTVNLATVQITAGNVARLLGKRGQPTFNPDEVNAVRRAGHAVAFIAQLPILVGILSDPNGVDKLIGSGVNDMTEVRILAALTWAYLAIDNLRYFEVEVARPVPDKQWPAYLSSFSYWAVSVSGSFILTRYTSLQGRSFPIALAAGAAAGMPFVFGRLPKLLEERAKNQPSQAARAEESKGLEDVRLDDGDALLPSKPAPVKSSVWCCLNASKKQKSSSGAYKALADDDDSMDESTSKPMLKRGSFGDCCATFFPCITSSKKGLQDSPPNPIMTPPILSPVASKEAVAPLSASATADPNPLASYLSNPLAYQAQTP